jgi:hypothetical protein
MCLAQLSDGMEAVNFYKKGIELMSAEYEKQELNGENHPKPTTSNDIDQDEEDENDPNKVTKLDISTAYGSIAELYLTDLWYFSFFYKSKSLLIKDLFIR